MFARSLQLQIMAMQLQTVTLHATVLVPLHKLQERGSISQLAATGV
jgi:hypothetical protein